MDARARASVAVLSACAILLAGTTIHAETPAAARPGTFEDYWGYHPGNGFWLETGFFLGGTDVPPPYGLTSPVSGGSGTTMTIGLMVTPLWAGDVAGLGLDSFAGVKYDSVGDSSFGASLTRYPVALGAHLLLYLHNNCGLILRGGILKEEDIGLSVSGSGGSSNVNLAGSLGHFEEGGIYCTGTGRGWVMGPGYGALSLTFRYSASYDSGYSGTYGSANGNIGDRISANSGGLLIGVYFNLL